MRAKFATISAGVDAWLCPIGTEAAPEAVQFRRIARFLTLLTICTILGNVVFALDSAALGERGNIGAIAGPATMGVLCLVLCHFRKPRLAAGLYIASLAIIMTMLVGGLTNVPKAPSALLFLPMCAAVIMLGSRACWLTVGAIALALFGQALWQTHDALVAVYGCFFTISSTLLGATMVSVGMNGFRRALIEADRSQELEALNERLSETLAASQRVRGELETVFDSVNDALAVFDVDQRELHANQACQQLIEIPHSPGRSIESALAAISLTTAGGRPFRLSRDAISRTVRHNRPSPITLLSLRRRGGEKLLIQAQVVPLRGAAGEAMGALLVMRDVTAEHRNERNLDVMRLVAQACASAAEERAVAHAALDVLARRLGVPNGIILMCDPSRPGHAQVVACVYQQSSSEDRSDEFFATIARTPIAPDAPYLSLRVIATGQARVNRSPLPDAPHLREAGEPAGYDSVACVPLSVEGAIVGCLALTHNATTTDVWEEPERDLLRAVADEIATSLHRARLYEEARRLALYDPLTGLRNHRALHDLLQRELASGTTQGLPVSVVMLDIDHFRKFNETYGHDVGDRALRAVARTIESVLADGSIAARYGGEEFAVILPGVDATHASGIARRALDAIAATAIVCDAASGQMANLTASLGHATFPGHASAATSLLKAADLALYAAKRSGRNRVMAYTPTLLEENARLLPAGISTLSRDSGEISLPSGADLEAVQALITAVDLRDGYTAAHSEGVSRYSVAIANEIGLPAEHIEALRLGALIHDVGKIGVPDHVLRKPGKLTDEEWIMMRSHTTMGEEILHPVEQLRHLLPLVRWHHERLDGSGYPDGLTGDAIPFLVRVLSVADVFEAFTAERPYHPGRPASDGLKLLNDEVQRGLLDGRVVEALETILVCQGFIDEYAGEHDLQDAA